LRNQIHSGMSRSLENVNLLFCRMTSTQTIDINTCEMASRPRIIGCRRNNNTSVPLIERTQKKLTLLIKDTYKIL